MSAALCYTWGLETQGHGTAKPAALVLEPRVPASLTRVILPACKCCGKAALPARGEWATPPSARPTAHHPLLHPAPRSVYSLHAQHNLFCFYHDPSQLAGLIPFNIQFEAGVDVFGGPDGGGVHLTVNVDVEITGRVSWLACCCLATATVVVVVVAAVLHLLHSEPEKKARPRRSGSRGRPS